MFTYEFAHVSVMDIRNGRQLINNDSETHSKVFAFCKGSVTVSTFHNGESLRTIYLILESVETQRSNMRGTLDKPYYGLGLSRLPPNVATLSLVRSAVPLLFVGSSALWV
jgi:hypothetical protein